jgi:hypothetical protein
LGKVAERVRWILSWTDLRSLLKFLGFWRLGKGAERVRWILSWTYLRSLLIFLRFWRLGKVAERICVVDFVVD